MKTEIFVTVLVFCVGTSFGFNRGHLCDPTKTSNKTYNDYYRSPYIAWYFDKTTDTCLAYYHLGCGGDDWPFPSESHCYQGSIAMDSVACPLHWETKPQDTNETIKCRENHRKTYGNTRKWEMDLFCQQKCPDTHYELRSPMMPTFLKCCSKEMKRLYDKNRHPSCPHGKYHRIGKTCADGFCDGGYDSIQNELFAACCPKAP